MKFDTGVFSVSLLGNAKFGYNRQTYWELYIKSWVCYSVASDIKSSQKRSLKVKRYRAVAIVDEVQTLGWVNTCNFTAYRNTVSWQCGRDSWPRNVSKVGYAVTLRACSVCCRYLAVAYGYGRNRCGRATSRCTSTPAPAVTVPSLWCDGQIPTAHRTSP